MSSSAAIICFGESLWNLLPTGYLPGGSPCRVALYLQQMGQPVRLISRVGDDELGHKLLAYFKAQGLDDTLLQLSSSHLTGLAKPARGHNRVTKKQQVVSPLAWDYIQYSETQSTAVAEGSMLVYGTLAARSRVSRETLYRLLPHASFKVLDLNLHTAHCSREVVKYLLQQADLVKCTESELAEVMDWHGRPGTAETGLPWLAQRFGLQAVCLVWEAGGASLYAEGTWWHSSSFQRTVDNKDSDVDAFLAALLVGYANGLPAVECLRRACAAGALGASHGDEPAPDLTETGLQLLLASAQPEH